MSNKQVIEYTQVLAEIISFIENNRRRGNTTILRDLQIDIDAFYMTVKGEGVRLAKEYGFKNPINAYALNKEKCKNKLPILIDPHTFMVISKHSLDIILSLTEINKNLEEENEVLKKVLESIKK